jgi:2-methylcitrate dehydratase PrpD
MGTAATARLAQFVTTISFDSLPADVFRQTQRSLLEYLGLVIGGSDEPAVVAALATVQELGGASQATVLGTSQHTSAPQAALVNGIASQALGNNAAPPPSTFDPHGSVLSAALAVGEWRGTSGPEFAVACAVGLELAWRIGLAGRPERDGTVWQSPWIGQSLGAAAAAGRLIGLTPPRLALALCLAGAQPTSVGNLLSSRTTPLEVGQAAANGILAAVLASKSNDAGGWMLDHGPSLSAFSPAAPRHDQLTDGLGQRWELATHSGGSADPLSDPPLLARVHDLIWAYLPRWKEHRLLELVLTLADLADVGAIAELLESSEGGAP